MNRNVGARERVFDRERYSMLIKNKQSGVVIAVGQAGVGKRLVAYTVGTERMSKGDVEQLMILCGPPGLSGFDFDLVNKRRKSFIIIEDAHLIDRDLESSIQKLDPSKNVVVVTGRSRPGSDLDLMVKRIEETFEESDEIGADMVIEF